MRNSHLRKTKREIYFSLGRQNFLGKNVAKKICCICKIRCIQIQRIFCKIRCFQIQHIFFAWFAEQALRRKKDVRRSEVQDEEVVVLDQLKTQVSRTSINRLATIKHLFL